MACRLNWNLRSERGRENKAGERKMEAQSLGWRGLGKGWGENYWEEPQGLSDLGELVNMRFNTLIGTSVSPLSCVSETWHLLQNLPLMAEEDPITFFHNQMSQNAMLNCLIGMELNPFLIYLCVSFDLLMLFMGRKFLVHFLSKVVILAMRLEGFFTWGNHSLYSI